MANDKSVLDTDLEKEGIEEEKAEFLQKDKSKDEEKEGIARNEKDAGLEDETGREALLEDDEISPQEEAFAEGAEDRGELGVCAYCGKPLSQEKDEIIEREIDGEKVWFCCEEHASKGKKAE